jgi:hypothetical protein
MYVKREDMHIYTSPLLKYKIYLYLYNFVRGYLYYVIFKFKIQIYICNPDSLSSFCAWVMRGAENDCPPHDPNMRQPDSAALRRLVSINNSSETCSHFPKRGCYPVSNSMWNKLLSFLCRKSADFPQSARAMTREWEITGQQELRQARALKFSSLSVWHGLFYYYVVHSLYVVRQFRRARVCDVFFSFFSGWCRMVRLRRRNFTESW